MAIICAEIRPRSVRACSSEISFSLPSPHSPARAVSAWRSAGPFPVRRAGSYGSGSRHRRGEVVVDEQAPDVLVREVADEILDVDAAVPERASVPIWLGDLGLDSDNTLETRLELAHPLLVVGADRPTTVPERAPGAVSLSCRACRTSSPSCPATEPGPSSPRRRDACSRRPVSTSRGTSGRRASTWWSRRDAAPPETLDAIKKTGVALKGPITTPIGTGFRSVNVALRHELGLYACVRPCKTYRGVRSRYEDVDLVVIRENTEDLYAGIEFESGTEDAHAVIEFLNGRQPKQIAAARGSRSSRSAPRAPSGSSGSRSSTRARQRPPTRLVHHEHHEAHGRPLPRRLPGIAKGYPDIEAWETLVDALCMGLVQRPEEFDVLVLPNLYGDIVSDLTAGLVGGLGVAPGANIGTEAAVFEATHGSAPKYTGQNRVNPTAMILSGKLMLEHLGERDAARRLEEAVAGVIADGSASRTTSSPRETTRPRSAPRSTRTRSSSACCSAQTETRRTVNGRKKVTVVGAGNVGATCALEVARSDYADVVVVDIVPNFAAGKALDMNQMASVTGYEPTVVGNEDYAATRGSDVVVITAGRPRSPGMSRDDLVTTNEAIVASVTKEVVRRSPKSVIIVVSEPARRDVPRRACGLGLPEGARVRDGGHPRHGPVLRVHRVGDGLVGEGRPGDGARRARRPDGPGRVRDDRRRRSARAAHHEGRSPRWSSGRERAAGARRPARHVRLVRPGAAAAQMVDAVCLDQARAARRCSRSTPSTASTWASRCGSARAGSRRS